MSALFTSEAHVSSKKSARRIAEPAIRPTLKESLPSDPPMENATSVNPQIPVEEHPIPAVITPTDPPAGQPESQLPTSEVNLSLPAEALAVTPEVIVDSVREEILRDKDGNVLVAFGKADRVKDEPVTLTPEAIVNFGREEGMEIFQDQHGNVFAWIRKTDGVQSHFECLRIRSRAFLARFLQLIKEKTNTSPPPSALKQAIEILEIQAYGTAKRNLENRRKVVGDETFIDLGDPEWRMVVVTRHQWQVRSQECPRFFRPQHLLSLPDPEEGGDVTELFKFVPVESEEEKLLMMTWVLAGLYAAIPNPILVFVGQQGSAKTTRSRRLKSLLDPSITPVLGDLEMSDLFLTFQHHAVPCFENVSSFRRREADMFCRAVTGNGVERRKLYSDSDQVLYTFRRPIIINGIDTPSTRPDFLDRCLIINCRRMEQFTTLLELDRLFEAARPRLFGAMLDLLVKTLAVLDTTPAATEFRMADFARFGRAVAVALGKQPEDFDKAYRLNIRQQEVEILEDCPMSRLLGKFAIRYPKSKPWEGTSELMLQKLKEVAHVAGDADAKKDLPHSARWLSSRLGELAPALETQGVFVKKMPRTNASRLWQVYSTVLPDPNAEPDDIFAVMEDAELEEMDK